MLRRTRIGINKGVYMKRDELLDLIDGVLIENDLPVLNGVAKEILRRLEEAGMRPTATDESLFGKYETVVDYDSE